jgi:hypothetical protein
LEPLAAQFRAWRGDALVDEALEKLAARFRSEEDDGPRMVVDVEEVIGDARAIRKLTVYTRVNEFLTLCRYPPQRIIDVEGPLTPESAVRREFQLKRWSQAKKEALIRGDMGTLHALGRSRD